MTGYYEHHIEINEDKLCPFILRHIRTDTAVQCNWHKNVEVMLVTDGDGLMQYGAQTVSVTKGDLIVINSESIHRPYSEGGIGLYYLIIDEDFCRMNGIDAAAMRFEAKITDEDVRRSFLAVVEAEKKYKGGAPYSAARLRCDVLSLLLLLCERYSLAADKNREGKTRSEGYIKRVIEYLNANFREAVELDALAEICGITKYHLARAFKRYTGQSILTYTNFLRCRNAELCIKNGRTVAEAAYESGFDSLSYFTRTYKRIIGVSPSKSKR